jgi:hypothetical protein
VAQLYGNELSDTTRAKEYADRAASINPGQLCLHAAYAAADIEYNTREYDDVFDSGAAPKNPPEPDEQETEADKDYVLVSPNPANPTTTITYRIGESKRITLDVYSITGQKVATLVDGVMNAGVHTARFNGSSFGSGIYFYRFMADGDVKTGRFTVLK